MMPLNAMPTDSTKMITCPDQETLADYLGGWTNGEQSCEIEHHLERCQTCQATIARVETEPDSILQNAEPQNDAARPGEPDDGQPIDPAVEYALSRIKRLPDPDKAQPEAASAIDDMGDLAERMIGPYQLIRSLGQGGMGSVYLARHCQLEKLVAIKVLPSRWLTNELHLSRFQREIRAAGGLNHPAIVTATDAGQQAEIYYLVMEYVAGLDLSRVARLCGPLSIADACEAMRHVALGLSHAHSLGIVHRDVKPSNLILSHSGEVKILDFGLARHNLWDEASAELTTVGQLMGTLDYMAPEQAECAATVDYRADLYALGATLFRLLVGRPPLAASPDLSPLAKLKLLASHTSPRADTLRPDLPKELANFIALLLHRDPARRPASAAHVAEKLEQFTAGNDLVALAERAEQAQPHASPSTPPATAANLPKSATKHSAGNGTGRWGKAIAVASFSAFLLATIWLIVETQKGQLVIESEAENVTVKLLSDGKQYDSVKVQPGATATKLFAGKYEIEIAGASDDLLIDRESVIIRRGETVLAKIGRPQSTIGLTAESSQITTEPVFEGKPLSVWLNQVETERSPTQLYSALQAVENLITPGNAEQVRNSLLNTMATLADQPVRSEDTISSLDTQIMKIIHESFADPTLFWASMTVVLKSSDKALTQRLYPALSRYASTPATPLVRYLAEDYFPTATDEETILAAANFARVYLLKHSETPSDLSQPLATTLFANKSLGFDFWLEFLPKENFYGYNQVMQQKAIEVLAMEPGDTTDALLTQATIVLTELEKQSNPARIALTEQDQQRVLKAVAKQLERLAQQPSEIVKLCDLNGGFSDYSLPQQFILPFFQYVRDPQTVFGRQPRNNGSLALELLELTSTIGQHAVTDAAVESILAKTRSQTIQVATKLHLDESEFPPQVRPLSFRIVWPVLDVALYARPAFTKSLASMGEFQAPDKQDMLAYLIHAAAYLALSDAAQERAKREFIIEFAKLTTEDFLATGDQNGDAILSESESPLSEAQFQKADIDNNGLLSREEIQVLAEATILDSIEGKQAQQSSIEPRFLSTAERIIERNDKNGDGVLERGEVKDMIMDVSPADANNDGKITVLEYAAWMQAREQSR